MWRRLLPRVLDNAYRGHAAAVWLFYPLLGLRLVIDVATILSADSKAQSADGIPLDHYGGGGAEAVIAVAALLGFSGLMFDLLGLLALVRYRAMLPLFYAFLVCEFLAHRAILTMKPIARVGGESGGIVTLILMALTLAGFILSLTGKGRRAPGGGVPTA